MKRLWKAIMDWFAEVGEAEPVLGSQLEAGPMVSVDGRGVTRQALQSRS